MKLTILVLVVASVCGGIYGLWLGARRLNEHAEATYGYKPIRLGLAAWFVLPYILLAAAAVMGDQENLIAAAVFSGIVVVGTGLWIAKKTSAGIAIGAVAIHVICSVAVVIFFLFLSWIVSASRSNQDQRSA